MAKRIGDAVTEPGAEFPHLGPSPRQEQTLLAPELPADSGKGVSKGRAPLAIPSVGAGGRAGTTIKARGEQGHDREQREPAGGGAGDRPLRPRALGLDAEMVAHLAEGCGATLHTHLPAPDVPADDLQRVASGIGAEQGLRVETLLRVAQQHPSMPEASIRSRRDRRPWPAKGGSAGPVDRCGAKPRSRSRSRRRAPVRRTRRARSPAASTWPRPPARPRGSADARP